MDVLPGGFLTGLCLAPRRPVCVGCSNPTLIPDAVISQMSGLGQTRKSVAADAESALPLMNGHRRFDHSGPKSANRKLMHRSNHRLYSITSSARAWSGSSGNPVRAQIASQAIIRSTSDARRRCSGETGLERPQSSQIRRSLKGHGTHDVCAPRPHIVSSCSDQRTCLLESRLADR